MPRAPKKPSSSPAKTERVVAVRNPYTEAGTQKASATFAVYRDFLQQAAFENEQEPMEVLLKKYAKSSTWVYICTNRIANAAAQIPLNITDRFREGQPDSRVRTHDFGLIDLLRKPNPFQSRFDFVESLFVSLELTGNAFIELAMLDGNGRPHELYVLNPSRITIVPDPVNYVRGYVYSVNGHSIKFPANEIIHIKYAHSENDYYGMAPLTAARLAVDVDRASLEWNRTFLLRGGWPVGAIESEQLLDEKVSRRLQRDLKLQLQRGKDAAGMVMLLTGGLKYNKIALTPKEMDWLDARRMSRDEILAIYGVPFAVAGLFSTEQTTARSAGVTQQVKNFYIFTMFPKMEKFLAGLNLGLAPLFSDRFEIEPDFEGVPALQDDVEQKLVKAQIFRTLTTSGWSINAALAEIYPHQKPFAWGNVAYLNSAMVPIDGKAPTNEPLAGKPTVTAPAVPPQPPGRPKPGIAPPQPAGKPKPGANPPPPKMSEVVAARIRARQAQEAIS